jgi:hypothetical protein
MTDRNNPAFSKALYEEIEEEVKKIIEKNYLSSTNDLELIRISLKCLQGTFEQYTGAIKEALERIEKRNTTEVL